MRRTSLVSLTALILILAVAGCGGSSKASSSSSSGSVPGSWQPAYQQSEPAKRVVVKKREMPAKKGNEPAQPDAPALPEDVDLSTDEVKLGAQALIVAREEVATGRAAGLTIEQRHLFIFETWLPLMDQKQALLQNVQEERAAEAKRQAAIAARLADHERKNKAVESDYRRDAAVERRNTTPILQQ